MEIIFLLICIYSIYFSLAIHVVQVSYSFFNSKVIFYLNETILLNDHFQWSASEICSDPLKFIAVRDRSLLTRKASCMQDARKNE